MYQDSILLPRWFFVCLHYPLLDIFPLKLWGGGGGGCGGGVVVVEVGKGGLSVN